MKARLLLLLWAAAWTASCSSDPSMGGGVETTTGSVAGRVRMPDGSPLGLAQVSLREESRGIVVKGSTDSTGRFELDSVPFGTWRVEARAVRADTILARTRIEVSPSRPEVRLDSMEAQVVVHVKLRVTLSSSGAAGGAAVFFADSSCFAPFDPWNGDDAACRTRRVHADSLGWVEMDDLPASTWYATATFRGGLSGRLVFRTLHGGGIWQLGDLKLDAALTAWQVRRSGKSVPFALAQFGDGSTSDWEQQQRVVGDDSGRIWLDSRLSLYHQPWVVFQADSLLAEGFTPDTIPKGLRVDLGASENKWIDLGSGGPMVSDSGNPIRILSVERLNHATRPQAPDSSGMARVGPFRVGGPWDIRILALCRSRHRPDSTWTEVWGGVLQKPALDPGTWAQTCQGN